MSRRANHIELGAVVIPVLIGAGMWAGIIYFIRKFL